MVLLHAYKERVSSICVWKGCFLSVIDTRNCFILFLVFIVVCNPLPIWFYRLSFNDSNWKIDLTVSLLCVKHQPVAPNTFTENIEALWTLKSLYLICKMKIDFFCSMKVWKILSTYPINGFWSNICTTH